MPVPRPRWRPHGPARRLTSTAPCGHSGHAEPAADTRLIDHPHLAASGATAIAFVGHTRAHAKHATQASPSMTKFTREPAHVAGNRQTQDWEEVLPCQASPRFKLFWHRYLGDLELFDLPIERSLTYAKLLQLPDVYSLALPQGRHDRGRSTSAIVMPDR